MDMAAEGGATSFEIVPFLVIRLGRPRRGYAHPGEFGQIIRAETAALYSWDEGGSSREPESAVAPITSPISGRQPVAPAKTNPAFSLGLNQCAAKAAADDRGVRLASSPVD
jgi:hypothetical protein